jgi:hypothetical protein
VNLKLISVQLSDLFLCIMLVQIQIGYGCQLCDDGVCLMVTAETLSINMLLFCGTARIQVSDFVQARRWLSSEMLHHVIWYQPMISLP